MAFLRRYATGSGADVYIPIIKRAVVDFAVSADWTPAAGDVKISIDGGVAANIGTLPVAVAMGNGAYWKFVFSDAELTGKKMIVTVADSATKAVEDQSFNIETFGHASALFPTDYSVASTNQTGDNFARIGAAGAGLTAVVAASVTGNVGGNVLGSVASVTDRTGFSLSAAGILAVWDQLLSVTFGVGSLGEKIKLFFAALGTDNRPKISADAHSGGATITAVGTLTTYTGNTLQTGDAFARLGAPSGASVSADVAAVKTDTAAVLDDTGTSGVVVAAASKTGYALSSAGIQAIWDALTSALATVGSIGKLLVDNLNATISSRSSHSAADVWASATRTLTSGAAPSVESIADAVWDEALSGHTTAGTAGKALADAATGGTVTVSYSQVAAAIPSPVDSGNITLRCTYNTATLTGLGTLTGRTKLYVTIKANREQADTAALLQWEETAGLVRLNGAAVTASEGALTVNDAATGSITFTLKSASGVQLTPGTYEYDVKMVTSASNVAAVKGEGKAYVRRTVTRAVS